MADSGMSRAELARRLKADFQWQRDRGDEQSYADVTRWWRVPELLRALGPALAALFVNDQPTVVLGVESRGSLLGPLVACALDVGFVEVRKKPRRSTDSDRWLIVPTPPDYRNRQMQLGLPARLLSAGDRVVLVDEWVVTGGQAMGAQALVEMSAASWLGLAVIVDALEDNGIRRKLGVRSLLHEREL
jgi:adenine phosphoribosyltransferase